MPPLVTETVRAVHYLHVTQSAHLKSLELACLCQVDITLSFALF